MLMELTTVGSRIDVEVGPSAMREADGGVAIRYGLHDAPLVVTFTREEAQRLVAAVEEELEEGLDGTPLDRLVAFYPSAGAVRDC